MILNVENGYAAVIMKRDIEEIPMGYFPNGDLAEKYKNWVMDKHPECRVWVESCTIENPIVELKIEEVEDCIKMIKRMGETPINQIQRKMGRLESRLTRLVLDIDKYEKRRGVNDEE